MPQKSSLKVPCMQCNKGICEMFGIVPSSLVFFLYIVLCQVLPKSQPKSLANCFWRVIILSFAIYLDESRWVSMSLDESRWVSMSLYESRWVSMSLDESRWVTISPDKSWCTMQGCRHHNKINWMSTIVWFAMHLQILLTMFWNLF
jgi:hypothetical protein